MLVFLFISSAAYQIQEIPACLCYLYLVLSVCLFCLLVGLLISITLLCQKDSIFVTSIFEFVAVNTFVKFVIIVHMNLLPLRHVLHNTFFFQEANLFSKSTSKCEHCETIFT